MTPLAGLLVRQIAGTGPITVAEYMSACLMHPEHGYYSNHQPLGAEGDFVTAPEISQMFGELMGLAIAQAWIDRGRPDPCVLAEIGPGRGTLMADALRATAAVPGFHAAMRLVLVEGSAPLRAEQSARLQGHDPLFVDDLRGLPDYPLFLVANELFDALPIRQFIRDGDLWRERLVGAGEDGLHFALSEAAPLAALEARLADTQPGDMVETSGAATALATEIGSAISERGGVALIVDYGAKKSLGDTLQALRRHRNEGPLDRPGEADLTAHVDFGALRNAATCKSTALTPQGVWLERLGITARAQALARGLDGAALETHVAAHRRLTHPEEMGTLFKVLGLHDAAGPPPGLEPASG